jgi:hypothetical protein
MHPHIKTAAITVGTVLLCTYVVSRFLPGLAARAGLVPRPAFPASQNGWAEPFGLIPVVGPGFSNLFAYGYPPIWSTTPAAATSAAGTATIPPN